MSEQAKPWAGCETTEKALRALSRIRETFGLQTLPAGLDDLACHESGIHDLYMNIKRQLEAGKLSREDKLLIAVGIAAAAGSRDATNFFSAAAREVGLNGEEILAAISVATICNIFNSYYKFRHLAPQGDFEGFKAPFNANTFMRPGISTSRMELLCIAVSSMNGCSTCVGGHIEKAKSVGVTLEQIDEAIKAAAAAQGFASVSAALSPTGIPEAV